MTYFKLNFYVFQFLDHHLTNKAKFSYANVAMRQRIIEFSWKES
jgi:hypothetical protein